jgi:AraC-like DNA-binding protein
VKRTNHTEQNAFPIHSYENGGSDPLSEVLNLLDVQSFLSRRFEATGSWALRFPAYRHMKFGSVITGQRWIWIEGRTQPTELAAGDFYLISSGEPYCFASDVYAKPVDGLQFMEDHCERDGVVRFEAGGAKTVGIGGRFELNDDAADFLLKSLPALVHVRANSNQAPALRSALDLLIYETETLKPGKGAIGSSLCTIVLVNILRAYLASGETPGGWLGALADPRIGSILSRIHEDIAHRWTLQELANDVGMSRTSFAERFRKCVGMAPLEYLTKWRMTLARSDLRRSDDNLAKIAEKIGYDSETSFSAAFRRTFGHSPGKYRALHQV